MTTRLLIHLKSDPASGASWMVTDESTGQAHAFRPGSLADAAEMAENKQVVGLVPSTDVLLTRAQLPSASSARMAKAVPYALEEKLTEDVDRLHFALGARSADGVAVAVVSRERMDAWLAELRQYSLEPESLIPDVLAMPWTAGSWTLLVEDGFALARTGLQSGFAVELDALPSFFEAWVQEAAEAPPATVEVYVGQGAQTWDATAIQKAAIGISVNIHRVEGGAYQRLISGFDEGNAIDLIQGSYSPASQWASTWRPWRTAAVLLIVLVGVNGIASMAEAWQLKRASQQLSDRIVATYRETFPDARHIVDPKAQMEQHLKTMRERSGPSQSGFLALLMKTGPALVETSGIELQRLDFREGRLDLELRATSVQTIEKLKSAMAAQEGLSVEVISATAREGSVLGRLRLRPSA